MRDNVRQMPCNAGGVLGVRDWGGGGGFKDWRGSETGRRVRNIRGAQRKLIIFALATLT